MQEAVKVEGIVGREREGKKWMDEREVMLSFYSFLSTR